MAFGFGKDSLRRGDPTAIIFTDLDGSKKEFLVDASINISTSLRAKVTSFPVEDKDFISDHVQPEPLQLRIEGVISQSPSDTFLTLFGGIAQAFGQAATSLTGLSSTFATAALASGIAGLATLGNQDLDKDASFIKLLSERGTADNEYPKRAMLGLVKMFNAGVPFKVRTFFSDVLYTNMVATSITFPQDARTGDSLRFSMQCVKINTVDTKFKTLKGKTELKASDPAGSSAAPVKAKGNVTGKTEEITADDESFVSQIVSSIFD